MYSTVRSVEGDLRSRMVPQISGGESTDPLGRTVILDNMETLRKKNWRPVKQRLSEPRSRFAVIRIPRTFF
jgi:hypothetical protein